MSLRLKDTSVIPNISADCVIFGFDFDKLNVLLIEREEGFHKNETADQKGMLALPGDHILQEEDLNQAAGRVLKELTGLNNIFLEQFSAFGNPNRVKNENDRKWMKFIRAEPNARVITITYYSLVRLDQYKPSASSFARQAAWYPVDEIPELAFDHNLIVKSALTALRIKLRNEPIGFELLPKKFTLSQLRKIYEVIFDEELEKRNFRRKFLKKGILIPLDEKQTGVPHKAARLFKFDKESYKKAAADKKFNFML